jgi:hypothetical protein
VQAAVYVIAIAFKVPFQLGQSEEPLPAISTRSVSTFGTTPKKIDIARSAGHPVELRHHEAAATVKLHILAQAIVNFSEKRSPRLRGLFNARHRVVARP